MKTTLRVCIPLLGLFVSASVLASSGGGFNTGGHSSQRIDQQYELGKSYYKARQADGTQLQYCIKDNDSVKKLSRRSVRKFKNAAATDFVNSLYNCAAPDQKIVDLVNEEQGTAVLYYLNKRFKLRLKSS